VLLPLKTVGSWATTAPYENVVALRVVDSMDAMTGLYYAPPRSWPDVQRNHLRGQGVNGWSSHFSIPPSTIGGIAGPAFPGEQRHVRHRKHGTARILVVALISSATASCPDRARGGKSFGEFKRECNDLKRTSVTRWSDRAGGEDQKAKASCSPRTSRPRLPWRTRFPPRRRPSRGKDRHERAGDLPGPARSPRPNRRPWHGGSAASLRSPRPRPERARAIDIPPGPDAGRRSPPVPAGESAPALRESVPAPPKNPFRPRPASRRPAAAEAGPAGAGRAATRPRPRPPRTGTRTPCPRWACSTT
jgi:hypothetical protein